MNNNKSSQKFKTGDTVQLKSGGPIMTIDSYDGKKYFKCLWFTADQDKVREGYFTIDSLQLFVE